MKRSNDDGTLYWMKNLKYVLTSSVWMYIYIFGTTLLSTKSNVSFFEY